MLFTLAMSVHRAETPAVPNWTAGLLCMIGIFGFTTAQLTRLRPDQESSGAGWAAVAAVAAGATFRYLIVFQETLQRLPPPVSIGDIYYLYDLE